MLTEQSVLRLGSLGLKTTAYLLVNTGYAIFHDRTVAAEQQKEKTNRAQIEKETITKEKAKQASTGVYWILQ